LPTAGEPASRPDPAPPRRNRARLVRAPQRNTSTAACSPFGGRARRRGASRWRRHRGCRRSRRPLGRRPPLTRSHARAEEEGGTGGDRGRMKWIRVLGSGRRRGFDLAKSTHSRRSQSNGSNRTAGHRAAFGPRGRANARPGPRLHGLRLQALARARARARRPSSGGPLSRAARVCARDYRRWADARGWAGWAGCKRKSCASLFNFQKHFSNRI
jgi:hypothetical protein